MAIPHVSKKARDEYLAYTVSQQQRAFAIAPGGTWAWVAAQATEQQAGNKALNRCGQLTRQRCTLYAVNDKVVFNKQKWSGLWGPYLNSEQASQKRPGRKTGERFFNLKFLDEKGQEKTLSQLRGKVVLVHFWGSWCPSCLQEFPSLLALDIALKTELEGQVEMVLLQVREPYDVSKQWATRRGFGELPLYNSMNNGQGTLP